MPGNSALSGESRMKYEICGVYVFLIIIVHVHISQPISFWLFLITL